MWKSYCLQTILKVLSTVGWLFFLSCAALEACPAPACASHYGQSKAGLQVAEGLFPSKGHQELHPSPLGKQSREIAALPSTAPQCFHLHFFNHLLQITGNNSDQGKAKFFQMGVQFSS